MSSPQRITLTGGRGRLAGLIKQHLSGDDYRLLSLSRSEGGDHLGLESLFVNNLIEQTDVLMHLAWSTLPISSERNVGMEWANDIPLLIRLLNDIVTSGRAEQTHFIFFSSGGAVYGRALNGVPSREDDVCSPIGWYGHAKLAAERIIAEFGRRHGLSYTILRVSNPYGFAVPHYKPQGIVPFLVKSAREGTPFTIWGDGTAQKDFLHYTDMLRAVEAVVKQRPQGIYNLSMGESHTIAEVIQLAEGATGTTIQTTMVPAHAWDVHDSLLDNQKLRSALDWSPQISLAEGIRRFAG